MGGAEGVPAVEVRVAGLSDEPVVARLRHAWAEEQAGEPIVDDGFRETFAAWFEREHEQRVTWLAYVDGEPAGMLNMLVFTRMPKPGDAVTGRPGQWGYVANVYVREQHRDNGVGRRLMEACVALAEERGFARLVLSPTERSIPFYARSGFEPATSLLVRHLR